MSIMTAEQNKQLTNQNSGRVADWLARHWQQVGLALAVAAVAGALGAFVIVNLNKLKARAWEQLSYANSLASRGQKAEALQTIDQITASNRSGALIAQTHMLQGDILSAQGKAAESISAYQTAVRQAPTNELRALAQADLAQAQEQFQKWDDALISYGQFLKNFPDHFLAPRAYEATGRIQMVQQKWADAQNSFERLVTLYPSSPWAKSAQDYILQIKFQQQKQDKVKK